MTVLVVLPPWSSLRRLSASSTMERNFSMVNVLPSRPTRVWRNRTGPRSVRYTATAVISSTGEVATSPMTEARTSNTRLLLDRARPVCGSST